MPPTRSKTLDQPVYTPLHEILDRGEFSDVTKRKYRNVLDQFVKLAGPHPNGWTRAAMDSFRAKLIRGGMRSNSIETYIASLRYVSKWYAHANGTVDFAVIQPIKLPKTQTTPRRVLTQNETERLLATCINGQPNLYDLRDLVLMIVDLETGLRVDGLSHMSFERFGQSQGKTNLYPSVTVPIKGKGGENEWKVPLSPTALDALERWQHAIDVKRGPVFRRLLKIAKRDETVIKVTSKGITTTAIYKMIVRRALLAGIGHVHPHILRHTFITWRVDAGVRPIYISAITGHKVDAISEDDQYGVIESYVNKESLGEEARKTTPPWFAQLVRRLLKEF
jgi:integrase